LIYKKINVLTATEKRFIKYWQDQRKGGRLQYYLLYILAGTFVATLVLSFLTVIFGLGLPENMWLIVIGSFCLVSIATVLGWWKNEKRFKAIIQREVREAKEREGNTK
jgi:hypothetical protein